jgi:hypothetical protein
MNSTQKQKIAQIESQKKSLMDHAVGISLNKILGSEKCQNILSGCREFRDRVFPPMKTIFLFIKQVLHPDKSCRNAVSNFIAEQANAGEYKNSNNTGPYCKARKRLPELTVKNLVQEVGASASKQGKSEWNWKGHEIKMTDGTHATMADTEENQKEFPQHGNQKEGVGFPIVRMVAVMSLAVGTVLDYAIGAYKGKGTGEQSLLRGILDCVNVNDILLGDRYYPSFF